MEMRDVGLTFPLYITVRNSGDALVTIATPLDPSDTDWRQASEIFCRTLVLILCLVKFVQAHAGIGRIELQVERRRLDSLLLIAGQASKAVGKGISNEEVHHIRP